ncbi:MAG: hypothetical protein GY811_22650 [Myxococcales bacterium]|nr:hypothetical protein [Myxococcales bacterium]
MSLLPSEGPQPSDELQSLVEAHLRDSLMLRSVIQAEEASLARIVTSLREVPLMEQPTLVGICLQRLANRFIADP